MDFWFEKATPKDTAKVDALETKLKLTEGYIKQVWMFHPPGCAGLAYASIWEGGHQRWPTNPDQAYHGDGQPFITLEDYYLEEPAMLTLKTWNLDDTFEHTVYIRVAILRERADPLTVAMQDLIKIIKRLMGVP